MICTIAFGTITLINGFKKISMGWAHHCPASAFREFMNPYKHYDHSTTPRNDVSYNRPIHIPLWGPIWTDWPGLLSDQSLRSYSQVRKKKSNKEEENAKAFAASEETFKICEAFQVILFSRGSVILRGEEGIWWQQRLRAVYYYAELRARINLRGNTIYFHIIIAGKRFLRCKSSHYLC